MKKYFLMATLALVTVALIGCKDKKSEETEDPGQQTEQTVKVVLSQSELELAIGGEATLFATLSPAKNLEITWTTSDAKIATVDAEGVVTGVAEGTATITASAEGATAATCTVTVVDPLTQFAWAGCQVWNVVEDENKQPVILNPEIIDIPLTSGASVPCVIAQGYALLWSEGIDLTEDGLLEGAGYLSVLYTPVYMIADQSGDYAKYYGQPIGNSWIQVVSAKEFSTDSVYTTPAATLVDPATHYAYLTGESETEGITGAYVDYVDYSDKEQDLYYEALLGGGIYQTLNDELYYNCVVGWSDGLYGLAINANATSASDLFVTPYKFANFKAYQYRHIPSESTVPAKKAVPARHMNSVVTPNKQANLRIENVKKLAREKQLNCGLMIAK